MVETNEEMDEICDSMTAESDEMPFQRCHQDIVTHVTIDTTGRRMATCSTDKRVAVWDRDEKGNWHRTACWKVHGGVVWKAAWAHPEFGQILATCSCDRSVHIWEQIRVAGLSANKWVRRAYLTDSLSGVTDVSFAPHHLGLQLATVCVQGVVRIYEAPDTMDLTKWSMIHELQAFHTRCSSVAWSQSPIHRPLLVVGSDDTKSKREERVVVYELHDPNRKFQRVRALAMDVAMPVTDIHFNPILNDETHQVAIAAGDIYIFNFKVPASSFVDEDNSREPPTSDKSYSLIKVSQLSLGDVRKAWKVRFNLLGNIICSSGGDGTVKVYKSMFVNQWVHLTDVSSQDYLDADDEIPTMRTGYLMEFGRGMLKESTTYI